MTQAEATQRLTSIDIARIMELLPHRYPFLLIDKVVDIDGDMTGTGIKNVTINEPFFVGHFPQRPVMPGVLIVEAMAQTAGAIVLNNLGAESLGSLVYFMNIDKAKFRQPVGPGDTLQLKVRQLQKRRTICRFACQALVGDKLHAEAEITAMMAPPAAT